MLDRTESCIVQALQIPAPGCVLAGTLYLPEGQPNAAVVLNSATGVAQGYYHHFATWLAQEQGMACLTYDYRDFGASLRGSMRRSGADKLDWCLKDMPAARAEMRRQLPGVPLWVIGHSIGGMLIPSQSGIEDLERVICVGSGLVHYSDHPWPYQAMARLFWFGHVPLMVAAMGYLPGKLTGFGADLPAPVYWQWRRWCCARESYLSDVGARLPAPDWSRAQADVSLVALSDDDLIPPKCVKRLGELYGPEAAFQELDPADFGLRDIGHLGAFTRRNAAIWPALIR